MRTSYATRHNLRFAREGYALPDLTLEPRGETLLLRWDRTTLPFAEVEFPRFGQCELPREEVKAALEHFVGQVTSRLASRQLSDTLLQREFAQIQRQRPAENAFCREAGTLGLDPYALSAADAHLLEEAAQALPDEAARTEFLAVTTLTQLPDQQRALLDSLAVAQRQPALRLELPATTADAVQQVLRRHPNDSPWRQGYQMADTLRQAADLSAHEATAWFGPDTPVGKAAPGLTAAIQAVVAPSEPTTLALAYNRRLDGPLSPVGRFVSCRALGEHLLAPAAPALITETYTARQQRNRAFAAELLAPAEWLRARIGRRYAVSEAQMEDLAEELGVSERVIEHQIANHGLLAE